MSEISFDPHLVDVVLCDLDGVVWLAHEPIAGSVDAVASLRASGRRVLFVTNNSAATIDEHEAALGAIGIEALGDVLSSAQAAATLVTTGERVLVTAGPGVAEAMADRGADVVVNDGTIEPGDPIARTFDVVAVGLHRNFDYARLSAATAAIHGGARLIGTNSDSTYPTPQGLAPGGGSILAAVSTAGGRVPIIAGKPHQPMADLVRARVDEHGAGAAARWLMVGDRPETDGLLARRIGCHFALVRSGVNGVGIDPGDLEPTLDVANLSAVADALRV